MWKKIKAIFSKAWSWIEALWEKHDDDLKEMVVAVLPMVIDMAFRNDLSGEEKKKAIVDAVIDAGEVGAEHMAISMVNEAVEIAANRYNIQIGKLTTEKIDNALNATLEASRRHVNRAAGIKGDEAENAGISLTHGE